MMKLFSIVFLVSRLFAYAPLSHAASVQELASVSQNYAPFESIPVNSGAGDHEDSENEPPCIEDDSLCDIQVKNHFSFQSYYISKRIPFINRSVSPPKHFAGSVFRPPIQSA